LISGSVEERGLATKKEGTKKKAIRKPPKGETNVQAPKEHTQKDGTPRIITGGERPSN